MTGSLSKLIDQASEFFAHRKGLLPLLGMVLIVLNLLLVSIFPHWGISQNNLFLHLGILVAVLGAMLARAL
jgi:hypothetical protein